MAKRTKSPTIGMPSGNPYLMDMPLGVHTHNTRQPTTAELLAARNSADTKALIAQNVPISVLERGSPEQIDQ